MINLGYFYGVISAMFWAISGISYEILSNNTENKAIYIILFFLFSSDFISLIFLIKFILKTKNFLSLKNYRKGIFFGGLAGVFGGTIGMFSYLMAIDLLGVNYAVPLSSTFPLFAGIIAYFFLKEKIQFIGFIGFFITIFSSVILFISKGINQFNLIGLVFIFFCILGWALEVVLSSYAMTFTSEYITYFSRLCFSCLGYIILLFFILKVDISNIINFIDYQKIGCFFIIVLST
ncbi:DMT family transporter, partial [Avibacterium paragallinarum]|nr:DMT family transporter [Avibacterium paragallinarum]